ncbi:MAG: D-alanine--D-alanine ligase family protein [Micromonosporaceae bacterium]
MNQPSKPRVAIIFGGRSTEHAISCVSAGSAIAALDPDEFEVVPVGITREGRWVLTRDTAGLAIEGRTLPEITDGSGSAVVLPADPTAGGLVTLTPTDGVAALSGVDVVLPLLHGPYGEDGTIQGLLEMAGIPYVGSGVFASAAGMDKEFAKKLFTAEGLPGGPYAVLRAGQSLSAADRERLGLPVFVKPARGGSSIGISKVTDWASLDGAVALARESDSKVLVEAAFPGVREIECGVLEGEHGGPPEASLPAEIRIVSGHDWYDFDAKYLDDACEFDLPPKLPAELIERIRGLACRAFTALDCAGLARVDFFLTPELEIYLNEINTMPGFTPTSMFPRMWAASGLEYPKLLARLIRTALHSH